MYLTVQEDYYNYMLSLVLHYSYTVCIHGIGYS